MKKNILMLICLFISVSLFAQDAQDNVSKRRIIDDAGLLTVAQISELEKRAEEIAESFNFDLVIVTKSTIDGLDPLTFADNYFDNNGFGFGDDGDGVIFLFVTNAAYSQYGFSGQRDIAFSTSGRAVKIFNTFAVDTLEKRVISYIRANNMAGASKAFFDLSEEVITLNSKGRGYNFFQVYHIQSLIVVWIFAIILGVYCLIYWKKQMDTIIPVKEADNYMTSSGLAIAQKKDRFLYSHVTKIPRVDKSSLAKGAVRMAASGRSKGGRSGRF